MSSTPESSSTPPDGSSPEGTPPEAAAESQSGIQQGVHPEQVDLGHGSESAQPRRIPIGTQRPGVKPPRSAPRYEYFSAPAPPATAGLQASGTGSVVGIGAAAAAVAPPGASTVASTQASDMPAATAPAADSAKGQAAPVQSSGQSTGQAGAPRREGRRDKRGSNAEKSPFQSVVQQKRVAVPNLRAALDDDLEEDFEAALAGVAIDDLITASTSVRADAPLEPGARLAGTVLSIGADTAFIDLGERRQGAMKLAGLDLELVPSVGDVLQLSVGLRNDDDGLYDVAFANRAVAVEDWSQLQAGMIVEARVTAANKGGLECDVAGLRGFMPASLVSTWRVENLEEMIGQTLESLVTDIVPAARRLVLSRRAVIEKAAAEAKIKLLETLEVGTTLDGIVRSVRDFGAFVDIGEGVEGLVHVSELANRHVRSVGDVVKEGETVECRVLSIDPDEQRMSLSIKALVAPSAAASGNDTADEDAAVEEAPATPVVKKHSGVLKGGTGRVGSKSAGEKFGLKW